MARQPRFLALGDSYTIGTSVEAADRWPVQLAALLRERGIAVADPQIIATDGWTTGDLRAGVESAAPAGPYDLVSLLIGVNDQYRGLDVDAYRAEFRWLLRLAVSLAGGDPTRVIVLSIPDWSVTPFAEGRDRERIAGQIRQFNEVNRAETASAGARYVDVMPSSRRAATLPGLIAADGLHPSGEMYTEWAALALPAAAAALQATRT